METKGRKRVVLRANGKRLDVGGDKESEPQGTSIGSRTATHILNDTSPTPHKHTLPPDASTVIEQTHSDCCNEPTRTTLTPHSPPLTADGGPSKVFHSTPLHPPPNGSWRADLQNTSPPQLPSFRDDSSSSSSSSSSLADSAREHIIAEFEGENLVQQIRIPPQSTAAEVDNSQLKQGQSHGCKKRESQENRQWRKKKVWKKKSNRIHPEPQPTTTPPRSLSPPLSNGYSIQHIPSDSPPESSVNSSCSLPPLLNTQLTEEERKPSARVAGVEWSCDGEAELKRCLPDQLLGIFIGTWNMQQLNVSTSS